MKIGIDARFFGPASKGLGRYTQKLIEHLENIDQDNEYVVFLMRENYDLYTPHNPRFTKVLTDYRWYTWREQLFFPFALRATQCDFIHFPHFNVPLLYCKPFITTIHDLILLRFPTHHASTRGKLVYWIKFLMYRIVIAHAIGAARHIIAVSEFTKKDILAHYPIADESISVTHEAGPAITTGCADNVATWSKVLQKHDITQPYLLYVGNAYPHKNLNALIDVFALWQKKHDDTHHLRLVLVGRDDYFYRRLRTYINQHHVENVIILHTVSDTFLETLYHHAHAFIFPSLYEGFGLPPLEACAYGTPVLSSRKSCMPEILGDAVLYTDVGNQETFIADLTRIITDEALRAHLKQAGPRQAARYAWEKTAQATYQIYQDVV